MWQCLFRTKAPQRQASCEALLKCSLKDGHTLWPIFESQIDLHQLMETTYAPFSLSYWAKIKSLFYWVPVIVTNVRTFGNMHLPSVLSCLDVMDSNYSLFSSWCYHFFLGGSYSSMCLSTSLSLDVRDECRVLFVCVYIYVHVYKCTCIFNLLK